MTDEEDESKSSSPLQVDGSKLSSSGNSSWFRSLKRSFTKKIKKTSSNSTIERSECSLRSEHLSDWELRRSESFSSESLNIKSFGKMSLESTSVEPSNSFDVYNSGVRKGFYHTLDLNLLTSRQKTNNRCKLLLQGVKKFNLEPESGLEFLLNNNLVQDSPDSVANFLFQQDRLSKKQIGSYLGGRDEFHQSVLREFVSLHQFTNLLLVQGLRQFLWSFRLPGEAQQIDRVMSAFADHYWNQNKGIFSSSDTVYILSFAIIMLNTALHNVNVKIKITPDQFVSQNKGIDGGQDLPEDLLRAIYNSIKGQPFKIPDENYDDLMFTFFSPDREGWLVKQGGSWKSWKRRWFVLSERCLFYFQHTAESVPKGIIPLENVAVRVVDGEGDKKWQFELFSDDKAVETVKGCKTDKAGAVVMGNHKVYKMAASSEEDRDVWMKCIKEAVKDNPVQRILSEKKNACKQGIVACKNNIA